MLLIEAGCWHQHCAVRSDCAAIEVGCVGGQADVIMRWGRRKRWGLAADRSLYDLAVETARVGHHPGVIGSALLHARLTGFDWGHGAVSLMVGAMWNHVHHRITASEILAESGLGLRHARRLFLERFGHSAEEELARQRLAIAQQLLRDGGLSMADVAIRCGLSGSAALRRLLCRKL
jgi:AraC family transcriptional regulator